MKKSFVFLLLVFAQLSSAAGFTLKSSSMKAPEPLPNKQVFSGMGCTGENISPALEWTGAPAGTKSFAVTAYDPDAPTGSGWWHWTVVNIPADTTKLEEGASSKNNLPSSAVEGRTDFGKAGYGGACPPIGDKPHRYIFTVWALKADKLDLNSDSSGAMVGYYLNGNSLGKASMTVKYGRK